MTGTDSNRPHDAIDTTSAIVAHLLDLDEYTLRDIIAKLERKAGLSKNQYLTIDQLANRIGFQHYKHPRNACYLWIRRHGVPVHKRGPKKCSRILINLRDAEQVILHESAKRDRKLAYQQAIREARRAQ